MSALADSSPARPSFYPALDGLRAIAVGMVFLVHFLPDVAPWGWAGVQIFFVLSGFLITGILFDSRHDLHRFRNFYVRRALRIFPLYYGFLMVCCGALLLTHGRPMAYFWLWFADLQNFFWLLTNGMGSDQLLTGSGKAFTSIGHLWTLAIEEQFYFLWPLLVYAVKDRRRLMQLCCGLIFFRLALAAYWQGHLPARMLDYALPYRMLPTQWDAFLLGGLLALWLRGSPSPRLLERAGWLAAGTLVAIATLLAVLHARPSLVGGGNVFDYRSGFEVVLGLPLMNVASAVLVLALVQPGNWLYRLCVLRPMRSLGRVSYGLYVFHLPVSVLTGAVVARVCLHFHLAHREGLSALVATVCAVAVAYASFYFFELPFLRLKDRFSMPKAAHEPLPR